MPFLKIGARSGLRAASRAGHALVRCFAPRGLRAASRAVLPVVVEGVGCAHAARAACERLDGVDELLAAAVPGADAALPGRWKEAARRHERCSSAQEALELNANWPAAARKQPRAVEALKTLL